MSTPLQKAILLLEDGTIMHGSAFGHIGIATGEICFNTGMSGYQEVFTDPSYYGQMLIMNNAHIGNYGVNDTDTESNAISIKGLIGRNLEETYSRKMATGSLADYLQKEKVVAINSVDTRALVAHVRKQGAMNCIISSSELDIAILKKHLAAVPNMIGLELASQVSTKETYEIGNANSSVRIAVIDYGIKKNILACMVSRGAFVKVFPAQTPFDAVKAFNANGYFISNGPGDPAAMPYAVTTVHTIIEEGKPLFGICLGHQLLALSQGIPTFKMHHGHRGLNHPVKNLITGKSEITTQNHGFGVNPDAVKAAPHIEITHVNLNDGSIEGIRVKNKPVFSVQYHPEATPGPHDSRYLFDQFIDMIQPNNHRS
jgi:carbamoyl-phosphate synthase small subunit